MIQFKFVKRNSGGGGNTLYSLRLFQILWKKRVCSIYTAKNDV